MNASQHVTILIKLKLTDMYLLIFETFYSIFENNTVQMIFLNEMALKLHFFVKNSCEAERPYD